MSFSTFRNAAKTKQKPHRERSQPSYRKQLGFLEKKKDYQVRTRDRNLKKKALTTLKRQAEKRNPDEFRREMLVTKMNEKGDTVRCLRRDQQPLDDPQAKLVRTQDARYVEHRRLMDLKKAMKLQESLHLIDNGQRNNHMFFVEGKKEVRQFDLAKHLNTHPELVKRAYNRLTVDQLKELDFTSTLPSPHELASAQKAKDSSYKELEARLDREKELRVVKQKIEVKNLLMDKKSKKRLEKKETRGNAAIYKWEMKRKK